MLELAVPTVALETAWREAHGEWGQGAHEDGFGLKPSDDVTSVEGFADWVSRLIDEAHSEGARCTYRWILEGGSVVGGIALGTISTTFGCTLAASSASASTRPHVVVASRRGR